MKKTSNRLHSLFAALAALILAAALAVPAFAVEGGFADLYYRMFDDAEVLTEDEDNELEDALEELSLRQSFDVTIATIESMESVGADSMEQFADDLYDYCQYGYGPDMDGVLLLARFENTTFGILKTALLVGVRYLFCTLLMAAIYGIMGYVIVFVFTPAFLLGMGLCAMLCSFLMLRILYLIGGDPDAVHEEYDHDKN